MILFLLMFRSNVVRRSYIRLFVSPKATVYSYRSHVSMVISSGAQGAQYSMEWKLCRHIQKSSGVKYITTPRFGHLQ